MYKQLRNSVSYQSVNKINNKITLCLWYNIKSSKYIVNQVIKFSGVKVQHSSLKMCQSEVSDTGSSMKKNVETVHMLN